METFIARQPIFDRRQKVFGYELLFRSGPENFFKQTDPDRATSKVIADSYFLLGIRMLTGGKRAFINVTRDILLNEYLFLVPNELVVVEVLENVVQDSDVMEACRRLKRAGYLLAMDDFIFDETDQPLLQLADFVKVDFLSADDMEQWSAARQFLPFGISLLAEKVETHEVHQKALKMGYHYFQGYFFSKPKIIVGKDIPSFKLHYFRILQEVHRADLDFKQIEKIIKQEVSLSFKLLRYINSAYFGLRNRISSINQALILLGEKEVRKWVTLIAMATMGEDKPEELVVQAIVRAKFCESLAPYVGLGRRSEDLFLVGMFSLIDAILDQPLSDILMEMPIHEDIKGTLLGEENCFREVFQYVVAHEKGQWGQLIEQAKKLRLNEANSYHIYLESMLWAQSCFQQGDSG